MANTYTQFNIHAVFAVKGRENILSKGIRPRIFEYIHGILKSIGQYPLAVNGYFDHVHVFFELNPSISVSSIMQKVKANSAKWINENRFLPGCFSWQEGYGGFSHSRDQRNRIIQYIMNQELHHRKKTFREEYIALLKEFDISFNHKYLFDFIVDNNS